MIKKKESHTKFVCSSCGYESVQWFGKCPGCGEWNTMKEFRVGKGEVRSGLGSESGKWGIQIRPMRLSEVKTSVTGRISSGIDELDRVLGGGFVPGEIVLLAGEPGVGKSTLLLKLGEAQQDSSSRLRRTQNDRDIIYVSGEESPEQIKSRAERLGVVGENITIMAETQVEKIIEEVGSERWEAGSGSERLEKKNPTSNLNIQPLTSHLSLLIVDSVQTLWSEDIEGSAGSVSQVKGCTQMLVEFAKKTGVIVILVGQINKEGEIAGPMMLSHMVDCVLFLEGERYTELRLLRGLKNRFGPTDEVGVFRMSEKGMEEVENPSELFLQRGGSEKWEVGSGNGEVGSVTTCAMEGTRPMLLEVQALVTQSAIPVPRRVVLGLDYNRVILLIAVLQKVLHLPLYNQEIIVKVSGGFKVNEPAADLGIALAIVSSYKNKPINPKTCVFGEVGLLGEIRRINGEEKRIKEAKKLGFTKILSSQTVKNLHEAVREVSS